jgi:PAS domain S-box-containing protein
MNTKKILANGVNWVAIRPKTSGYVLTFVLLFFLFFISFQRYHILKEDQEREMSIFLDNIHEEIEHNLKKSYSTLDLLSQTVNDEGVVRNFDIIARQSLAINPTVSTVKLAPNGIVKYIYPMNGNEAAMNLDILKSKSYQKDAQKSIKNKQIYFSGPYNLIQGGTAIIGRFPVYKKNKFWGFTSVIIKLENLLKASGYNYFDHNKYDFQFSNKNPITNKEEFYFPSKIDSTKNNYFSKKIPYSNWKLYLIKKNPEEIYLPYLLRLVLGIIIAIAFGLLTTKILKTPEKLRTLLKDQETKLLKNELKFKTAFDNAPIGFALLDALSGNLIELNDKYCTILGYTKEELVGKNVLFFTHPDDKAKSNSYIKLLEEGFINEFSIEKRYITKYGKIIWLNLTVSPIWENNEKPTTNIAFIKDITENKESQALIEKSQAHFKSLFDNNPLPLWDISFFNIKNYLLELNLVNENPKKVYDYFSKHPEEVKKCISMINYFDINKKCIENHGIKNKTEFFNSVSSFIDFGTFGNLIQQIVAISQNAKHFEIETEIKNKKGELRNINLKWNVINGYEKSYKRVILSTEDITNRKIAEAAISNSHQRTESIINNIDGIVWEFDIETMTSTFVSKKVETILGYTADDYMGNPSFWEDHIYPEDLEYALRTSSIVNKTYTNHDYEYRMIAKDGRIVWIKDVVNFVVEKDKPIISRGIMIDVTHKKEAERDLNNSFNLVTEQNKRLLNFSYIVSHNLRSHTSNIESIISLIESSESEEERTEMMHLLKSVSNSLDDTMKHLNEVVNINTNIDLIIKPLDLSKYIIKAQEVLSEQILLNKTTFIVDIPDDGIIDYNPAYLESILYNLISNAIRYRHPQRKPIITIKLYKEKDKNVIEVSDNGIGIDLAKNGDKIFGMYKTFSNNSDARGIGLFITKNQVDAMGGTITVASDLNLGTTFKIYTKWKKK